MPTSYYFPVGHPLHDPNKPTAQARRFSILGYGNGVSLHSYRCVDDPLEAALEPGYFDRYADMLHPGDSLIITSPTGQAICAVTEAGIVVLCRTTEAIPEATP